MDILSLGVLAFALALDAFAVALSAGAFLVRATARQTFRLSFHFGLFQFLMPILGWAAGSRAAHHIAAFDHWLAMALLGIIGIRMMRSSMDGKRKTIGVDVTRGMSLVSLSLATSMDALAVGLSLGMLESGIVLPSLVIGGVAGGMTVLGLRIGEKASAALGRKMEFAGGILLVLIGARIVIEHMTA